MRVSMPYRAPLNQAMLNDAFKMQSSIEGADFWICGKTAPDGVDPARCILFQSEPPLTGSRRRLYKTFSQYHTVITFCPTGPNQFPFGSDPTVYPYSPGLKFDRVRKNTRITGRGVYYAGRRNEKMAKVPDCYHSINLYGTRHAICRYLLDNYPQSYIFGQGWPRISKAAGNRHWREQKQRDIDSCHADFVLCLENSMLENYVSEKIHDGFSSDRVALYLGAPNIHQHVPAGSFINLNRLFDRRTKVFDMRALTKIMHTMPQRQYNAILRKGRAWRATLPGKFEAECARMTEFIIKRITGD